METKKCTKCGIEKGLECFHRDKSSKDGLQFRCKECVKNHSSKQEVKEHKRKYDKDYSSESKNKERIKEQQKAWYQENKERVQEQHKAYYAEYYAKPEVRERQKERHKAYRANPENKDRKNKNDRERKNKDPWYKLCCNMRTRMNSWLKKNLSEKLISAVTDMGCVWPDFKPYLEAMFYPHPITGEVMSWENYGQWHLDHIHPLAKVDPENADQVKAAWHYTNLQPLWAIDNLSKGDRIVGPRVVL